MPANTFSKTWAIPFWLGVLTLFGLLSALLGTGVWYLFSWVALIVPVIVILYKVFKK